MIALLVAAALVVLLTAWARARQHRWGAIGHVRRGGLMVGAVTLMLAWGVALAPDASAGKPVRIPAPIGNSNTFPAGTACPFTVRGDLVGGNQVFTFFDDGRFHATGRHIDRITNVETGASTMLDLQGDVDVIPTSDGGSILRSTGISSFAFVPGDAGPGDTRSGRFYLFTGGFVATADESGLITSFTSTGRESRPAGSVAHQLGRGERSAGCATCARVDGVRR